MTVLTNDDLTNLAAELRVDPGSVPAEGWARVFETLAAAYEDIEALEKRVDDLEDAEMRRHIKVIP